MKSLFTCVGFYVQRENALVSPYFVISFIELFYFLLPGLSICKLFWILYILSSLFQNKFKVCLFGIYVSVCTNVFLRVNFVNVYVCVYVYVYVCYIFGQL
jgi:hypothetical protein